MGRDGGEGSQGGGAEGDDEGRVDGIDCPNEVVAAVRYLRGTRGAVLAIPKRSAQDGIGDEHLLLAQFREGK